MKTPQRLLTMAALLVPLALHGVVQAKGCLKGAAIGGVACRGIEAIADVIGKGLGIGRTEIAAHDRAIAHAVDQSAWGMDIGERRIFRIALVASLGSIPIARL